MRNLKYFIWALFLFFQAQAFGQSNPAALSSPSGQVQYLRTDVSGMEVMARQGNVDSQVKLGDYYSRNGPQRDLKQAVNWYAKAAENGSGDGAFCLGEIYRGRNTPEDNRESLEWFAQASKLGNSRASYWLAQCYRDGTHGVPVDYPTALKYFQAASQQGEHAAVIPLAEMIVAGKGTAPDPGRARKLLEGLSGDDLDASSEGLTLVTELEGFKIRNPEIGVLRVDHTQFRPFYIWRRVYQKKGVSHFKPFEITEAGDLIPKTDDKVDFDEWNQKAGFNFGTRPISAPISQGMVSASGKWRIQIPPNDQWADLKLQLTDESNGSQQALVSPEWGWGWTPYGWSPHRDLFYFSVVQGDTTDRQCALIQLDPEAKVFTVIGHGQSWQIDPEGRWVIWVDGVGMAYVDRQVHAYNLDSNKDYLLTSGHSENGFYKWAGSSNENADSAPASLEAGAAILQSAKAYYYKGEYAQAVSEYERAILTDSDNAGAYGLMGYSLYREGDLSQAVSALKTSIEINSQEWMSYYNLSLVYWKQGDRYESIQQLKRLYELDPHYRYSVEGDAQFSEIIRSPEYKAMWRQFIN